MDWPLKPHGELFAAFSKQFEAQYHETVEKSIAFRPDYIFMQCAALVTGHLHPIKEQTSCKIIQWTGDCRLDILPEVISYKNYYPDLIDLTLLASGIGQKDMYEKALGHEVKYWQHGVGPSHLLEVKRELTPPMIRFVGNAYSQFEGAVERNQLCELLSKTFQSFEVWGSGFADGRYTNPDTIPYAKTPELYNNSYIGISANIINSVEGYWSNRPLDIMAAGSCCLMRRTPNMENWFKDYEHCVYYDTNEQAVEKIKHLLASPELREEIAEQGQKIVLQYHTYDYRVEQFSSIIHDLQL